MTIQDEIRAIREACDRIEQGEVPPAPPSGIWNPVMAVNQAAKTWELLEPINDWREAVVFPPLLFTGMLTRASIHLEFEVGVDTKGLRNFIYLTKNPGKWKGDCILLLNRGANGGLAVSHTLLGFETEPVRCPLTLFPGDHVSINVSLEDFSREFRVWIGGVPLLTTVVPEIIIEKRLRLQLGNASTDESDHPVNAGWKLLRVEGSVG